MIWYDRFNVVEAGLWVLVALVVLLRSQPATQQQRRAVAGAGVAFVVFGATDLLEVGCAGFVPLWLWALKIACGCAILLARYTYRGWRTFRWTDREFVFGVTLLAGVVAVIAVQRKMERNNHEPEPAAKKTVVSALAPAGWVSARTAGAGRCGDMACRCDA